MGTLINEFGKILKSIYKVSFFIHSNSNQKMLLNTLVMIAIIENLEKFNKAIYFSIITNMINNNLGILDGKDCHKH